MIVPARNRTKAETTLKNLVGNIEIASMNLGNLNSVRKFAEEYADTGRDLYALINNAGIMACPLERIGNDWEAQFGICHIGHFELTMGLKKA